MSAAARPQPEPAAQQRSSSDAVERTLRRNTDPRRAAAKANALKVQAKTPDANADATPKTDRRRPRTDLRDVFVPRRQHNLQAIRYTLRTLDAVAVGLIILVGVWTHYVGANDNPVLAPLAAGVVGSLAFIAALGWQSAYDFAPTESLGTHLQRVLFACLGALGMWLTLALFTRPATFEPDALARSGAWASAALLGMHLVYYALTSRLHRAGIVAPTVVMLGATPSARRLIEHNARTRELNIVAIFDDRLRTAPHDIHGVPVVGRVDALLAWDQLPYVDRIVVTLPGAAQTRKREFVARVRQLPNRIAFVVDEFETLDHVAQSARRIARIGLREVTDQPKPVWQLMVKRIMDVAIAAIALAALLPVMVVIAVAIKATSPGPVLFKQAREGFNNRIFQVYKFRSLRAESSDATASRQVSANDDRVTSIGRIIRKTSLDELPQLWNVIRGEMTLVGPRPHTPGMKTAGSNSRQLVADYAHRHRVKPGMTGWAQINGSRGPMHEAGDVARRVALDVEYIENSTPWWDLWIMARTVPCLLGDTKAQR